MQSNFTAPRDIITVQENIEFYALTENRNALCMGEEEDSCGAWGEGRCHMPAIGVCVECQDGLAYCLYCVDHRAHVEKSELKASAVRYILAEEQWADEEAERQCLFQHHQESDYGEEF